MNCFRAVLKFGKKLRKNYGPVRFGNRPRNLKIKPGSVIEGTERMYFGDDVSIGRFSDLKAFTKNSSRSMRRPGSTENQQVYDSKIVIGNRVTATRALQIGAFQNVTIEDDVLIASNVFISDATHAFTNANVPYRYQGMFRISPVLIKRGAWIGQNAVIMPGVTIGAFSIVGANSVVTRSIPDRCIAAGAPARVLKVWNENLQEWVPPNVQPEESADNQGDTDGIVSRFWLDE